MTAPIPIVTYLHIIFIRNKWRIEGWGNIKVDLVITVEDASLNVATFVILVEFTMKCGCQDSPLGVLL